MSYTTWKMGIVLPLFATAGLLGCAGERSVPAGAAAGSAASLLGGSSGSSPGGSGGVPGGSGGVPGGSGGVPAGGAGSGGVPGGSGGVPAGGAGSGGVPGGSGGVPTGGAGSGGVPGGSGGVPVGGAGSGGGDPLGGQGGSPPSGEWLPPVETTCPGAEGMVGAELRGGQCFKIDALPVTRGKYHAWAETLPGGSLPNWDWAEIPCSAEIDVAPVWSDNKYAQEAPCFRGGVNRISWPPPEGERDLPMVCVNWCQAAAYCQGQGKRLCHTPMPVPPYGEDVDLKEAHDFWTDAGRSEWYAACTATGTRRYCHGTGPVEGVCVRANYPAQSASWWNPAEDPLCEGGYSGLRMMGVVAEWVDAIYHDFMVPRCPFCNENGACDVPEICSEAMFNEVTFRCCAD